MFWRISFNTRLRNTANISTLYKISWSTPYQITYKRHFGIVKLWIAYTIGLGYLLLLQIERV